MRILAIDPGYERLGIAILEKNKGSKEVLLFSECFHTLKALPHAKRLSLISLEIKKIIREFSPSALSIETLFLTTNHKTVMAVAEARGVILSTASTLGLTVFEYSPPQIKLAVTGDGRADKKAIQKMIPLLIKTEKTILLDDEFDAIAAGLACLALEKFST